MKYAEALEYLQNLPVEEPGRWVTEVQPTLQNLLTVLGNPEQHLNAVRISGGKGKSSVIRMLSAILAEAGYRTVSLTDPVFEEREKFLLNGKPMAKTELGKYLELVKNAWEKMSSSTPPLPLLEIALTLTWATAKKCDIVFLETSFPLDFGQEFDAANPCCAETEDTENNRTASPIRSGLENEKAFLACDSVKNRKMPTVRPTLHKQKFTCGSLRNLTIPLAGTFQTDNVVRALEILNSLPVKVSEDQIRAGLMRTECPGRFQILQKKPYVIADNVTDEESAKRFQESIRNYFTNKRILYIISMLKDAQADRILTRIAPDAAAVLTTAMPGDITYQTPLQLAEQVREYNPNVTALDSPEEAVEIARLLTGPEDVLILLGPLPLLGKLITLMEKRSENTDTHGIQYPDEK